MARNPLSSESSQRRAILLNGQIESFHRYNFWLCPLDRLKWRQCDLRIMDRRAFAFWRRLVRTYDRQLSAERPRVLTSLSHLQS